MITMEAIIKSLQTENKLIKDMKGKARNLKTIAAPKLPQIVIGKEENVFGLTKESLAQICNLLHIPFDFLVNCPPSLMTSIINTFIVLQEEDIKWELKAKDTIVISVNKLSNTKYISNIEIATLFKQLLENEPKVLPQSIIDCEIEKRKFLEESIFQFYIIFSTPLFYEEENNKKGVFPALLITNSEIGNFGVKVDFAVFRENTNSYIISLVNNKRFFRGKLSYSNPELLKTSLIKQFGNLPKSIEAVNIKYKKAREKEIKDINSYLTKAKDKYKFSGTIIPRILEICESSGKTLYSVSFAFAKAAREQLTGIKRYNYECLAGVLINDV
jgi:hypothetical protein